MRRLAFIALSGLLAVSTGVVFGQENQPEPDRLFTIHIHTDRDRYPTGTEIRIMVDKTNITESPINCSISGSDGARYVMDVRYEDGPTEKTEELNETLHPKPRKPDEFYSSTSSSMNASCKPGETQKDWITVTKYFHMTNPGRYEITFSQETFPGEPKKSVLVKSNTITITVLPADDPQSTEK